MANAPVQTSFMSDLADPMLEQFRMRALSVFNWGTFSELHTIPISEKGHLILGPSGAGKSTLQDAISVLTVKPAHLRLNAAADESTKGDKDRNLMSYVRGAWGEEGEQSSSETVKKYLRPDATTSAIALEYRNRNGRVLTLVRVFWVTASGPAANLNKHYLVVDGPFDMAAELAGFTGEKRKLRAALDRNALVHQYEGFDTYADHWCRVMGIDDPSALELLHRTQSTKNLADLNTFMREFMLGEPGTFAIADQLVNEFVDLDEAHRAVVAARQQIEVLAPARAAFEEREQARARTAENEALLALVPAYRETLRVALLEAEGARLVSEQARVEAEQESTAAQLRGALDELRALELRHLELGGGSLAEIEGKIADLTSDRERSSRKRAQAEQACKGLGWTLADDPAEFAAQVGNAKALVEGMAQRGDSYVERANALAIEKDKIEQEFRAVSAEVRRLEASPSNIPDYMQDLRDRLCAAVGLKPANLPFVGELLQVKAGEQAWAGAAERLLRPFALSLLVPLDDQRKVARWVDATHLGKKLVYYGVDTQLLASTREPGPHSILHKLEKRDHPMSRWVQAELARGFDYQCVASAADLIKGEYRITEHGQIRHGRTRTEKDDRYDVRNRERWVLGFDSRAKLELFREKALALVDQLEENKRLTKVVAEERQLDGLRSTSAAALAGVHWQEIDVGTLVQRIADLEAQRRAVREANPSLAHLDAQLAQARSRREVLETRRGDLGAEARALTAKAEDAARQLERARVDAGALTASQREALGGRLPAGAEPTLATVSESVRQLERGLHEDIRALSNAVTRLAGEICACFTEFIRRWPQDSGALQSTLDAAGDFFALLRRVEEDGLPAHEERFKKLLRTQSGERLAELSSHLQEARRDIGLRLDDVNDALFTVPYNPGTYLHLRVVDIVLPESKDFREKLKVVFSNQNQQSDDPVEAEKQFQVLRDLVNDLRDLPERRKWREAVLDVRKHVEFLADELDRKTDEQIEVYAGSGGRSGGQRQKLTSTCLAAALRYKLGGKDGGPPTYGAVVLDEAYTKTDAEFTRTSMRIFTELGFQMIVGTPLKGVLTLEEFAGGATYVAIKNRRQSSVLQIEYDAEHSRLKLSEKLRDSVVAAEADEEA